MESREPSHLAEQAQPNTRLEEKQPTHTGKPVPNSAPWAAEQIQVEIHKFPSQNENPPLHYPRDYQEMQPKRYQETYPLSAKAFVCVVDFETAYFGLLAGSFNPLVPYRSDDQSMLLFRFPLFLPTGTDHTIQVRHSRVTKQPYLFETDEGAGEMWAFRATRPTPEREYEAFHILGGVGSIKFEVDSSNDPAFDFDLLLFQQEEKELVLFQLDLRNREIRSKRIPLPSGFATLSRIMSTELVTVYLEDKQHRAYSLLSGEVFSVPLVEFPRFLESGSVFNKYEKGSNERKLSFFLKQSSQFYYTRFKDWPKYVAEINQLIFVQGASAYYIFRISEEGPECLYQASCSWKEHHFLVTTYYLLEYTNHRHLKRCVPFNLSLINSSKRRDRLHDPHSFTWLDDWTVIGDLGEGALAYSRSRGFFLLSPNAPPESCLCF